MREILFRAKRTDNKEWIEGSYIESVVAASPFGYITPSYPTEPTQIYTVTLGEFTGMFDKNGKKIFEGDIVVLDEYIKESFKVDDGEVRWGWGGFYIKDFSTLNSLNSLASYDCILRGEVIGNIHDNPELLTT